MASTTTSITSVYPMDSMVADGSDGLPVYDRPYNASDLRQVMRRLVTDGVCAGHMDELAVTHSGGSWSVSTGAAFANGLLIGNNEARKVIEQFDIPTGSYAYVIVAGRFDSQYRDGAIYAKMTENASLEPERTQSLWELVLGRIDWLGNLVDYRRDEDMCGLVRAVPVDNDLEELYGKVKAATGAATGAATEATAAAAAAMQAVNRAGQSSSGCQDMADIRATIANFGSKIADLMDGFFYDGGTVYAPQSKASFADGTVTLADTCSFADGVITLA